jgi:ribosomal protein L17
VNWDDKNKVEDYIKRQQKSKQMLQKQTDKLQSSLGEVEPKNNLLKNRKEVLKQRIEELKKTDKQNKLLAEIAELAKKLNKDGLVQKAKELAQQNKQQERSLERILELVKRFYIEQKTMQIANKLQILSKDQELIEKKGDTSLVDQEEIRKRFEEVKEQLEEVTKDNEKLKEPLDLPDVSEEEELITKELLVIEEKLKKKDRNKAKKGQKKSADKMQQMSSKLQSAMMEMEAESTEENMEDLRKILENLITFSFKQEVLMNKFGLISTTHPDFGKDIRGQDAIRTYFEHIDDSLYVLSMRLPKISLKIQEDVSVAHYNLEQSLENFSENRFNNGIANQRYVMTSANSLADYLSNLLNSMKNAAMKLGKGEGKSGGFSLPDIIKKQGELSDKMKEGSKKGEKGGEKKGEGAQGKKPGSSEASGKNGKSGNQKKSGGSSTQGMGENGDLNGALYEIYKEQSRLRQQLQEAISAASNGKLEGNSDVKNVLKTMEQLEKDILMFGFNNETIQKMQQLNYELLKLEKAALEQGEEQKRKSNTSKNKVQRNKIKALNFKSRFSNQIEILNRQSLPLQQNYKLKVREYFSESNKRE